MANEEKVSTDSVNNENEGSEKKENKHGQNDNEDTDSLEEQPLDIGENYLVKRSDGTWCKNF